jgi:ppGpp synthetase/RelA/SpoT-type nucleotidyltranferase
MVTYPPPDNDVVESCVNAFLKEQHRIAVFGNGIRDFFSTHPTLTSGSLPAIHSVKYRVKDVDHLREKIVRKKTIENRDITPENLFTEITDLAGVRVLHLHMEQFVAIHEVIEQQKVQGHWYAVEPPKAYTWDPELQQFFVSLGIEPLFKESHYTSVHYLFKPNENLATTCEIQVRTLFEEVWGEIDHVLNYPVPTESVACREQLRVMAKMVGAGTRLAEAIFRSHKEFSKKQEEADI